MKKLLLIIILAFVICNLTFVISYAQEPYLHIYWILGATDPGTYPSPDGQNMYYDSVVAKDIIGPTGNSGVPLNFAINAATLATLEAGRSYDVFTTYAIGPDFYHIGPQSVRISGKGYEDAGTLAVLPGAGEIPGVDNLKILRVDTTTNYKLTWNSAGASVNVYRLATTEASPVYDNTASLWGSPLNPSPITLSEYQISGDQIGTGLRQAYYKVVLLDFDGPSFHGLAVATADAVGKFNLNLAAATNLFSIPLMPQEGNNVDQVFSNQLSDPGLIFYNFNDDSAQNYNETRNIVQGKAYWLALSATRVVSQLGRVARTAHTQTIYGGSNFNLIGSPTVKGKTPFDLANLPPLGSANQVYLFDNAAQRYYGLRESSFGFDPGVGYWYYHTGSDYPWTLTRP